MHRYVYPSEKTKLGLIPLIFHFPPGRKFHSGTLTRAVFFSSVNFQRVFRFLSELSYFRLPNSRDRSPKEITSSMEKQQYSLYLVPYFEQLRKACFFTILPRYKNACRPDVPLSLSHIPYFLINSPDLIGPVWSLFLAPECGARQGGKIYMWDKVGSRPLPSYPGQRLRFPLPSSDRISFFPGRGKTGSARKLTYPRRNLSYLNPLCVYFGPEPYLQLQYIRER